jgi:glucose/mannose transport system substrate-binding protein
VKAPLRSTLGTIAASLICAAALAPITGCGSSAEQPPDEGSHVVEIFSWWTAGGEKNALDALLSYHVHAHPDEFIINAAQESAENAREVLDERIASKRYPDMFQLNAGVELASWAARTASDGTKLLTPLDTLPEAAALKAALPPAVLSAVSVDNQLYAIPVNVHRNNSLFYNKKIFDANNLTPPTTWAELLQVADALSKAPTKVIPLAVGSRDPWTVTMLVFENVLIATQGGQYYLDYFGGKKTGDDAGMVAALQDAAALWKYTDVSGRSLRWDDAVAQVESGQAAMTIMGDWAKGHFESVGQKLDVDFGQIPMPGAQDSFVYNPDCFPLMTGAHNPPGAKDLLATFASVGGQDVFNPLKGSIPARSDANKSLYDAASQRAMSDFQSKQLLLSVSGLLTSDITGAFDTAFGLFADSQMPEDVLVALRANYAKFAK